MKALEWTQHFPHYNPMGAIRCHGNQSSDPTWSKTKCNQSPTPMIKLVMIGPLVAEIFEFENVYGRTNGRTNDARTPDRPVYYKLTFEPSAQEGSGELIILFSFQCAFIAKVVE